MAANQGNIPDPDEHSDMGAGESDSNSGEDAPIINRSRLQQLVHEIDPMVRLDEDVEKLLLYLADDFIDSSLVNACRIAKNRRSSTIELRDVQMHLERTWNIIVPRFGNYAQVDIEKRSAMTEAHLQSLAHYRKIIKEKWEQEPTKP